MTQYIEKSAVVAEINRVLNSYDPNQITSGRYALASLRDFLDTLEVKEVDLVKEMEEYFEKEGIPFYLWSEQKEYAKHFYELGLKTQKRESKKDCEINCPNFDESQGTSFIKTK